MWIYVTVKHMGNITKNVVPQPFWLEHRPETLRELITEAVHTSVAEYRARGRDADTPAPLTDEQWQEMRELGKFAFGVQYNSKEICETDAMQTALQAVEDGLVCVFRGTEALTALDERIALAEGDTLTFVKLAMLSGRLW